MSEETSAGGTSTSAATTSSGTDETTTNPEGDAGATESNAESTSTFTTQIEIEDDDEKDVRKMILDDYERCLAKHGTSLGDLLRLHQQEAVAAKKLTLKLEQVTKKETKEKKKAEALNKTVDDILKGVSDMVEQPPPPTENKTEALKQAVEDIRRQIDEYRRRKDNLERQIDQLKAQVAQGQAKLAQKKTSDEELARLASQVDESKADVAKMLRDLNQSLNLVNRRLNTNYYVKEDPESASDVRNVLDKLLNDVVTIVTEHRKLNDDIENLKRKIAENEKHIEHAKQMNDFLTNEAKKLLAIGNRKEAQQVDPNDYEAVRKFVDETFQDVIDKLKRQNKDMAELAETKVQADREESARKADLDRELAVKQAKIDAARDALNKLNAQNEFLRNQLSREQKSPVGSESETEILRNLKNDKEASDKNQNAALEAQLQRSRAQNDDARRQLNDLTSAINEADEKLAAKRRELQDLNDKADQDRDQNRQKVNDLEKKIANTLHEIESLERELADLNSKSDEARYLKAEIDKLGKTEKELGAKAKQMEDQLRNVENERNRLGGDLNKQIEECNNLRSRLRGEDLRRDDLEDKLREVKEKIADTDRKIERERGNAPDREGFAAPVQPQYGSTPFYTPPAPARQPDHFDRPSSAPPVARRTPVRDELDDRIKNLEDSRNLSKNRRDMLRKKLKEDDADKGKSTKTTKKDGTASKEKCFRDVQTSKEKSEGGQSSFGTEQQYDVSGQLIVDLENGQSQSATGASTSTSKGAAKFK